MGNVSSKKSSSKDNPYDLYIFHIVLLCDEIIAKGITFSMPLAMSRQGKHKGISAALVKMFALRILAEHGAVDCLKFYQLCLNDKAKDTYVEVKAPDEESFDKGVCVFVNSKGKLLKEDFKSSRLVPSEMCDNDELLTPPDYEPYIYVRCNKRLCHVDEL